jgi:hypothetical protein
MLLITLIGTHLNKLVRVWYAMDAVKPDLVVLQSPQYYATLVVVVV